MPRRQDLGRHQSQKPDQDAARRRSGEGGQACGFKQFFHHADSPHGENAKGAGDQAQEHQHEIVQGFDHADRWGVDGIGRANQGLGRQKSRKRGARDRRDIGH